MQGGLALLPQPPDGAYGSRLCLRHVCSTTPLPVVMQSSTNAQLQAMPVLSLLSSSQLAITLPRHLPCRWPTW